MSNSPLVRLKQLLSEFSDEDRNDAIRVLRAEYKIHQLERDWNVSAEVILEALHRANDLTQRMFKGIIAEAAFKVEVVERLADWTDVTPAGQHPFDFKVQQGSESVTIQVKLQRKESGVPLMADCVKGLCDPKQYVVETQKSRKGEKGGENTRPYRFGEFDILAVSMEPATRDWSQFRFTVERWLVPREDDKSLIAIYQPVSLEPNDDWTDNLETAIEWLRSGVQKTIKGAGVGPRTRKAKRRQPVEPDLEGDKGLYDPTIWEPPT